MSLRGVADGLNGVNELMHTLVFFTALVSAFSPQSPFNSYEVFLTSRNMPGACTGQDRDQFRNRSYSFLGNSGQSLTLRDGKHIQSPLGTPEFETSLETAVPLNAAGRLATLLIIRSQHVHVLGGTTYVLVVECRKRQLVVWFEASGEGIRDATFTEADQTLSVSRWIWSDSDAHCCPSMEAEERYRWGPRGPFVRVTKSTK